MVYICVTDDTKCQHNDMQNLMNTIIV